LHKQNFDLKLELYHRRQKQESLEARLEALEKQMQGQAELQEVNDQLLAELEKRDQAVEEAVSVIVALEDKVDRLMKEREGVRAVESDYDSTYFRPGDDQEFSSSPPTFEKQRPANSVPRMPSFLSENSEGTEALRSLYVPLSRTNSDAGLPKLAEEVTVDGMDSPRLSVLSESSFVSVYGMKPLSLDETPEPESPSPPRRNRTSESVEKWMDGRPATVAPPMRAPKRNSGLPKSQYLSINTILDSPLQRLEKLKVTLEKGAQNSTPIQSQLKSTKKHQNGLKDTSRRVVKDQDSFENQRTLPPTPDTFSTDTLRRFQMSNSDLFAQNQRTADATFLDSTSTFPTHQRSHVSMRPRSAGETVTSKRDGHGWDTETQGEYTEAGSISDLDSMYNGPSFQRPRRVMTPDLFTFGGGDDGWGQEIKYSTAAHIPAAGNATADRYRAVRRSSMSERQKSDDHIPQRVIRVEESLHESPVLPDRRSSLAAPTKLRKVAPNQPPTPTEAVPPTISPLKNSKISRLSGRIFGNKSESMPASPMKPPLAKTPTYFSDHIAEEARATPPPIKRSRTGPVPQRPMSAGTGSGGRRLNEFGGYSTTDDVASHAIVEDSAVMTRSMGSKKWFGIARAGSLRKN
jgi:hypothetical protein